ncbi:hypothetical protein [Roseovarius sp. A-2]|uniref:hypothetical protein n=1 Tax=Roseovarius sp. A-2 TaxID=1570360 RepID=UPI0009B53242|nr:hypothetical protein [Roseovarius sp. A-2]
MEALGYLAAASEDIALTLAADGSQRGRRHAQNVMIDAVAICDKAVLSERHRSAEPLASEFAGGTGQSFARSVVDLYRDGRLADTDPRRKVTQAELSAQPIFSAATNIFL